jgi:hypothetical protein
MKVYNKELATFLEGFILKAYDKQIYFFIHDEHNGYGAVVASVYSIEEEMGLL